MKRYALLFRLKSKEYKEEYLNRHNSIWPEVKDSLKNAGFCNYSIWNYGDLLFAYYESDEQGGIKEEMLIENQAFQKWRNWMEDIIYIDPDGVKEWPMEMMFYLT